MPDTRIVVTGASGFVGTHLREALEARGGAVTCASLRDNVDVLDMSALRALPEFHSLVHLAGRTFVPDSWKSPRDYYETNVTGTLNCLELCRERNARLILASTYVYGDPVYLPIDERHPVRHWNPYASSKILAEQLCEAYAAQFDTPSCILRFFNLFGLGQNTAFLMPQIVHGLHHGRLALGNPDSRRDFLYIGDAVEAILAALDAGCTGCVRFNVGSGVSHRVSDAVRIAQKFLGGDAVVTYNADQRPNDVMDIVANVSLIGERLGWRPRYTLEHGLEMYIRQYLDRI
ncbi:MAG: NAD-dependent epimerase/dehydratase family protein [Candidatus Hydrogenedentes bacterium]|nr:NAD-dependent epimerase/dehydratase family protein [Candidatus Hydrogenedentota bacterium]